MKRVLGALVSLCFLLSMSGMPQAAEAPSPGPSDPAVKSDDAAKKSSTTKKKTTKKKASKKKSSKKSSSKKSSSSARQGAGAPAGSQLGSPAKQ